MLRNSSLGKQAVVLGGGIAGLLAARVLTEHFERDHYPEDPIFRPGVPQAHHIHILQMRGQQIIEELFPGIGHELMTRGAVQCDFINDNCIRCPSGWLHRSPSQIQIDIVTRHLLEWQIRQALSKNPQIAIIDRHEVVDVTASTDTKSITGVVLRARPHASPVEQALIPVAADLVVDATGHDSKAPQWLKSLGYAPPPETLINPFMGYASRFYAPPSKWQHAYFDRLFSLLPSDPSIVHQFAKVTHMVESPTTLFSPSIAAKILFARKMPSNDAAKTQE